jgi:hypothetical protein
MPKTIRKIRIEGKVAYVPLSRGYEAVIDAEDIAIVEGFNWTASPAGRTVYAGRIATKNGKPKHVSMHRAIIKAPKGKHVDHIDGNALNNQKSNLRLATPSQNQHNARLRIDNPSGYKGVRLYKPSGKWQARISAQKKQYHLGYFDTIEEAHQAYIDASNLLHGEFGKTS